MTDILGYFLRNPQALDSSEGIARWRVMEEQVHRSVEQTEAALAWLLAEGYLQAVETPGGAPMFRLDPERRASAASLLSVPAIPPPTRGR